MIDGDWIEDGRLLAMAAPWPEELRELQALGIGAVVSLTERLPLGFPIDGVEHLHEPVRDFHPPTQEQLDRVVAFVDAQNAAGRAVAVHCAAGRGRTGTFVAACLVAHGFAADAAIREVRRRRPGSVETSRQEAAVRAFAERRAEPDRGGERT